MSAREQRNVALGHLAQLHAALRKIGLTADLAPTRQPFPGLAVKVPAGRTRLIGPALSADVVNMPAGTVMILAGTAHYWRQKSDGDLELVGPIGDVTEVAQTIHDRLNRIGRRRR